MGLENLFLHGGYVLDESTAESLEALRHHMEHFRPELHLQGFAVHTDVH